MRFIDPKRLFYADRSRPCRFEGRPHRDGQKMCKYGKKVIAPDGFDD